MNKIYSELKIDIANRQALERLVQADAYLVGCSRASEVIAGFKKNLVLHSGPKIMFGRMRGPHRNGIIGAVLFEGLAKDENDALQKIENGEIEIGEANDYCSGGPGAGITSASMAVLVVREKNTGTRAFAAPIEGALGGGLGGWGVYNQQVAENLRQIANCHAPLLNEALKECGGISVRSLFAAGLQMGDEEHSRQVATDKLFLSQMLEPLAMCSASEKEKLELLRWLNSCKRFVHHIGTAAAVACLKSASGIACSNMVTAMCGNGVEFGIKLSASGDEWFTAPAPGFTGRYFSPEWSDKDAAPWLGDSSNVEAYGLGGMAAAAAPVLLAERGGSCQSAVEQTQNMQQICLGENPHYRIPLLNGQCVPAGIDPRKVITSGILPMLHGGILSKDSGGQIGIGYASPSLECFQKAQEAFERKYCYTQYRSFL